MAPRNIRVPGTISVNEEPVQYFTRFDMFNYMDDMRRRADGDVQAINPDVLLNTPVDDFVSDITDKHTLKIPELMRDDAYMLDPVETKITMVDFGRIISPDGTILTLVVPFTGDAGMFWVRPTTFDTAPPQGNLNGDELILRVRGVNLTEQKVTNAFNALLDDFERYLNWQRATAAQFNLELEKRVRKAIEARRERLLADRNLVANLPYKIRARPNSSQTYTAPIKRKPLIPQRATTPAFKPEPVLDEADYQGVLSVIESMTLTMERNPTTFAKLDEESLRDMYLVPLNGQFEGAATGETFNASGKTDILIRVEDRNIFIAECKIWRGPKYLTEAIDQLFTYLTWRDTKAAIIVFNRNKDFSAVLSSMRETVDSHPNKKHGPKIEGETRFRYVFGLPTDQAREIVVTVLAFNIPG
jgi:hypothetical protein